MTLSTTTNRVSYAGNSATTAFSFPYYILQASDLVVKSVVNSTGVATTLVLSTDYTISGSVQPSGAYLSGCTINTTVAVATGSTLVIYRDAPLTQATHWVDGVDPALVKETAFDKLTMLVQRLKDLVSRAPTLSDAFSASFSTVLPVLMTPNYLLGVKSDGSGFDLFPNVAASGTVTSVALTAPAEFSVSGSPVTGSGTLVFSKVNQSANRVYAGPTSGGAAAPTFRALVAADFPAFPLTNLSSGAATNGQFPLADGGGGITWQSVALGGTVTSIGIIVPAEFSASSAITTSGSVTISKATQTKNTVWAGPTAGSNAQPAFRALVVADLPLMGGASSGADGTAGIVTKPLTGQQGLFFRGDGSWAAVPTGTVTSVDLATPGEFSVSGDPITGAGTITISKVAQAKNTVWAGPASGGNAQPSFRAIVPNDLPIFTGCTSVSSGITGSVPAPSAGNQANFLRGDGVWSLPTAGIALGPQTIVAVGNVTLGSISQSVEANAGAPCTITLPTAASMITAFGGNNYIAPIIITNTTTNLVTVAGNGADTILGSATAKLQFQWSSITLYPNNAGNGWMVA